MKVIDYFFNKKFDELLDIEFSNFRIKFNGNEIEVIRDIEGLFIKDTFNTFIYARNSVLEQNKNFILKMRKNFPFLKKISFDKWIDNRDGEILTTNEIRARYGYAINEGVDNRSSSDWLNSILDSGSVVFVETNRLISADFHNINPYNDYNRSLS